MAATMVYASAALLVGESVVLMELKKAVPMAVRRVDVKVVPSAALSAAWMALPSAVSTAA